MTPTAASVLLVPRSSTASSASTIHAGLRLRGRGGLGARPRMPDTAIRGCVASESPLWWPSMPPPLVPFPSKSLSTAALPSSPTHAPQMERPSGTGVTERGEIEGNVRVPITTVRGGCSGVGLAAALERGRGDIRRAMADGDNADGCDLGRDAKEIAQRLHCRGRGRSGEARGQPFVNGGK